MQQKLVERVMSKGEAEALDARIVAHTDDWYRSVAPLVMEMKERQGYVALGYDSFQDYCASVDKRMGHPEVVARLMKRATVEGNLGIELPAQHAYVLARLPTAEAQQEVFDKVKKDFQKPIQLNFEAYVDSWFRDHEQPESTGRKKGSKEGWTRSELEDDEELAEAFDRIEEVYGHADRKFIQEGGTILGRKDVIALAAFHESRMKAVHYLIMAKWGVAEAFKFINSQPTSKTKVEELHNHVLSAPGFFYTFSVNGVDYTARACHALQAKIKR